jgi:alpha-1,3/alpha-1,6-mannosyltransferase
MLATSNSHQGGYDPRNAENHSTYSELVDLSDSLSLKNATSKTVISALSIPSDISVLFLHSVPSAFKTTLLSNASLLVYTPLHEHFGIVPLEAMLVGTPVLAANEGGPTETVVENETGWLRDVRDVEAWTKIMRLAISTNAKDVKMLAEMGRKAKQRVVTQFSKSKMAETLDHEVQNLPSYSRPPIVGTKGLAVFGALFAVACGIAYSASVYGYIPIPNRT